MNTLRRIFQGLVALAVMLLVANYFNDTIAIHPYIYYGVAAAALVVPVFWAAMHTCGGMLFGIAAGGFLDGLRLGMTLGIGMALGKFWPYALAAAAGVYLGGGPLYYAIGGAAVALFLFALDRIMHYFWKSTNDGHDRP